MIKLVLLAFVVFGAGLVITNTPDVVYAQQQETIKGSNYDETRTYIGDGYRSVWTSAPQRILDYVDYEGNPVYVDFKHRQENNKVFFDSFGDSLVFDIDTCTLETWDESTRLTTLSHTIKEAVNGTDVWYEIPANDISCDVTYTVNENGIQLISSKGDFDTVYDIDYRYGFEWTYKYQNNDNIKTDHKYGFTFVCDGVSCDDVKINDMPLNDGDTKTKNEIINQFIKIGKNNFDLKEWQHGYTWALKKQQNKTIVDFTHSKGKLGIGESLIVDPVFGYTSATITRVYTNTGSGTSCPGVASQNNGGFYMQRPTSGATGDRCYVSLPYWDISSISDSATIDDVTVRYDVNSLTGNVACDWRSIEGTVSTETATNNWNDALDGTLYVNGDSNCSSTGTNYTLDLGSSADSDLESDLADDEFGLGVSYDSMTRDGNAQILDGGIDLELQVTYTTGVYSPGPPTSPSGTGLPYMNNFTWNTNNATGVEGYAIWNSTDNITWSWLDNTANFTGSEGFYIHGGLYPSESNYYKTSAFSINNGTNSTTTQITSDYYPDAPTISTNTVSENQIDVIYDSAGSSNGGDVVKDYNLQTSINGGTWTDLVSNSTHVNFYNHTGLSNGDVVLYGWRDGNGVGWSDSANATGQTYTSTIGIVQINGYGNVGNILNMAVGAQITDASPLPVDVNSFKFYQNNTLVKTVTSTETISSLPQTVNATLWYLLSDDLPHEFAVVLNVDNVTGTVDIMGTGNFTITREYDPSYVPATDPTYNPVNYTATRSTDQDTITLKVNRDESGNTWQIGCLYQTPTQASLTGGGEWSNATDVGYFLDQSSGRANSHYYITCYNSDKLFTVISYTNSSITLLGIEAFDSIYGSFLGVPVGVFFIVMAAGMANNRTAPNWIVVILGMAGIMSTIGFFTLDQGVWALAIIAGLLGLLVGRKIF